MEVIACRSLDRGRWRNQGHGQLDDRPLQHHHRKPRDNRNQRCTRKDGAHAIGIAPAIGLGGKAGGRHAQEAKAPEHIGKNKRANRNRPDIMRAIEMSDHSRIDRAKQRNSRIGKNNRQGQRQNASITLAEPAARAVHMDLGLWIMLWGIRRTGRNLVAQNAGRQKTRFTDRLSKKSTSLTFCPTSCSFRANSHLNAHHLSRTLPKFSKQAN